MKKDHHTSSGAGHGVLAVRLRRRQHEACGFPPHLTASTETADSTEPAALLSLLLRRIRCPCRVAAPPPLLSPPWWTPSNLSDLTGYPGDRWTTLPREIPVCVHVFQRHVHLRHVLQRLKEFEGQAELRDLRLQLRRRQRALTSTTWRPTPCRAIDGFILNPDSNVMDRVCGLPRTNCMFPSSSPSTPSSTKRGTACIPASTVLPGSGPRLYELDAGQLQDLSRQ